MALISLIISVISAAAAIGSYIHAKRSADAAERGTKASEVSADEAQKSREFAETATLHGVRQNMIESAPKFYIALEASNPTATLEPDPFSLEQSVVEPVALESGMQIEKERDDGRAISFDVCGVMQNRDPDPVYLQGFNSEEFSFIDGESELCDGDYREPARDARGRHVLSPGQATRFQWHVNGTLEQWMKIAKAIEEDWGPIGWLEFRMFVSRAISITDYNDTALLITITAMHSPVRTTYRKDNTLSVIANPNERLHDISIETVLFAHLPDSAEELKPKRHSCE